MTEQIKYITATCRICNGAVYKNEELLFENKEGSAPEFLLALYKHISMDYPKFYKMDNLAKLGLLGAEIVLKDDFKKERYKPEDVAVVLANSNASLDADTNYWDSVKNIPSPALFVYTLPNIVVGEICIRNGFKGENIFFIQDRFDASFINFYVNDLFDSHNIKACVCGWVEMTGEEYKAVLYLVEKPTGDEVLFSVDNINNIYELTNG